MNLKVLVSLRTVKFSNMYTVRRVNIEGSERGRTKVRVERGFEEELFERVTRVFEGKEGSWAEV